MIDRTAGGADSPRDPGLDQAIDANRLRRLIGALDLTRLEPDDPPERIDQLCRAAASPGGGPSPLPAAVCILPEQVARAHRALETSGGRAAIRVATVANFPGGDARPAEVGASIERALADGADEIDVVLPWRALVAGERAPAVALLRVARSVCGQATMKVILETGALDTAQVDEAAGLALDHGADFLKTSTGKGPPGATPAAADRLLQRIQDRGEGARCGLKVSGGIRTAAAANEYLARAERRMGVDWPTPARFRIGASGLFDALRAALARRVAD